jgi:hypothetical protein
MLIACSINLICGGELFSADSGLEGSILYYAEILNLKSTS